MRIFMVDNFRWRLIFVVIDCIAVMQLIVVVVVVVAVRLAQRRINNGYKVSRQRILRCKRR